MLEKPAIQDETIIACLRDDYGLDAVVQVDFLPLGADRNTAVYRALTDTAAYFVKLRSGTFEELTIIVPKLLHDQGIRQVIAPLSTRSQQLWTRLGRLGEFALTVSPFIEGHNAYEVHLHDQHWIEFGRALKAIHSAAIPSAVIEGVQREGYSGMWRERVKQLQAMVMDIVMDETTFSDAVAAELAAFIKTKRPVIDELVQQAERLASTLQARSLPFILCHADIHAGNLLIETAGQLYIVDWDTLIAAPKERDLMYVGGGLFAGKRSPQAEAALFYQGYGAAEIDQDALAYYRCERIVQDIVAYCEQILMTDEGGQDRAQGLRELTTQFLPNQVVEIALKTR